MTPPRTILFTGGGTGGHIFPSLAVVERLAEVGCTAAPHFVVSGRALDAQILTKHQAAFTPVSARPFSIRPWHWPAIASAWHQSMSATKLAIEKMNVGAVVAMGGFVCPPVTQAARAANVPIVLVNLDAVPGRANRYVAGRADHMFTVYPTRDLPGAETIGLPLRRSAVGPDDQAQARRELGLDPAKPVLFVTGASQGASSLNRLMVEWVRLAQVKRELANWQILHLSGEKDAEAMRSTFQDSGITAKILPFCDTMGLAWRAATIAISRSGAGSVAEAWANRVPTIFFPYPYHKDQHQRLNAEPLARLGGAILMTDLIEPSPNARQLTGPLLSLMANTQRRAHMVDLMRQHQPVDGAKAVAVLLAKIAG